MLVLLLLPSGFLVAFGLGAPVAAHSLHKPRIQGRGSRVQGSYFGVEHLAHLCYFIPHLDILGLGFGFRVWENGFMRDIRVCLERFRRHFIPHHDFLSLGFRV